MQIGDYVRTKHLKNNFIGKILDINGGYMEVMPVTYKNQEYGRSYYECYKTELTPVTKTELMEYLFEN
jgi:predicted small secreted protein